MWIFISKETTRSNPVAEAYSKQEDARDAIMARTVGEFPDLIMKLDGVSYEEEFTPLMFLQKFCGLE